jgi:MarR family transcriptional regulator, organic hydroperoxide resistance regulator
MNKNLIALSSRIADNAHRLIINELEKSGIEGIVPSHGSILHLLYMKDDVTMKELADFIHKTKPTVTVLVNKLEKFQYVYREKSDFDSRIVFIRLTKKGLSLKPLFEKVSNILNKKVYEGLDEKECVIVEKVLLKILDNLK